MLFKIIGGIQSVSYFSNAFQSNVNSRNCETTEAEDRISLANLRGKE